MPKHKPTGSLRLTLVRADGAPLGERVDIRLRIAGRAKERTVHARAAKSVVIGRLAIGRYDVEIVPTTLAAQTRRVEIRPSETTELCVLFDRHGGDEPPCRAPKIADDFDEPGLASALAVRLAGMPADGSAASSDVSPARVIWIDRGDEVLVHLDSMRTRIMDGLVLVSVDLETDQTGRTPLVVSFAVGRDGDGGLIAVTDEYPRGNGLLASRWGRPLQAAAWQSLLGLASEHAGERGLAPLAIAATRGRLSLHAGAALRVTRNAR